MENITTSKHLGFKCSVFMTFTALYFLQLLDKQCFLCRGTGHHRTITAELSVTSTHSFSIHAHPAAGCCSLSSPIWISFVIVLKGFFLRLEELLQRALRGNIRKAVDFTLKLVKSAHLPSPAGWDEGGNFLAIKRRWLILNFMHHFHLSYLTKSLIHVFPPEWKWEYVAQDIKTIIRNAGLCSISPVSYPPNCTTSSPLWSVAEQK